MDAVAFSKFRIVSFNAFSITGIDLSFSLEPFEMNSTVLASSAINSVLSRHSFLYVAQPRSCHGYMLQKSIKIIYNLAPPPLPPNHVTIIISITLLELVKRNI